MGIDRKAITRGLFDGQQKVANGVLSDDSPLFNPDIARYDYDPEGAKALLKDAGWTPGSDGICENANGDRLSLELVAAAGNQTREQIANVIQNQLRRLCVEIKTRFVSFQEFNSVLQRHRRFTGLTLSSITFSPAASPRIALASGAVPSPENAWVGDNFSGYKSDAMDAALRQLDCSFSAADAKAAWAEVQKIFSDDLPMLPLYFYVRAYVTVPDLKNFRQATYDPLMIWAQEWSRE
jgi:peptide/nickel transport system substrate-binding protein